MAQTRYHADANRALPESMTSQQMDRLKRALAKMVVVGAGAGVSIDQMIALLNSGMSVKDLMEYVFALADDP